MKGTVAYEWRLREIMAARGLNSLSDLIPLLVERGIDLSASQLYRLLGSRPERLSLPLLGALCDALECTVEDLCRFRIEASARRRVAGAGPAPIDPGTVLRPKRAQVRRPGQPG